MSEQLEVKSLVNLATNSGVSSRSDQADKDAKSKTGASRTNSLSSRERFDGLLKTFLGGDKQTSKSRSGSATNTTNRASKNGGLASHLDSSGGKKTGKGGSGNAASKMSSGEKERLKKALDKTAVGDVAENCEDPAMAAAAQEAAMIIWNLLYGDLASGAAEEMAGGAGVDIFARLADMIGDAGEGAGALGGMGAAGLDGAAFDDALETANASAEMNIDAVLAALEELLDGMPRGALGDALAKMGVSAKSGDPLREIADALNLEVVEVETGNVDGRQLLDELGGQREQDVLAAERQKNVVTTAEFSGNAELETEVYGLFTQFLEENVSDSRHQELQRLAADGSKEAADEILASFAKWVASGNNSSGAKDLAANPQNLIQLLGSALGKDGAASGGLVEADFADVFSRMKNNLESLLQFGPERNVAAGQQTSAPNSPQSAQTMSTMLDKIENIERLSEAMRMANQGPVKNLTLQLSPPELGKVMLRVESRDGVVSAFLRVEKAEAAAQLTGSLQQLRENLKAQGIELGELDIRQQPQGQAAGYGEERRKSNREADADEEASSRRTGSARGVAGAGETEAEEMREVYSGVPGSLNLFA